MAGLPYFPTTLPAQTVVGNLAATPREAQAIPIAALSSQLADASTINFTPAGAGAVARSVSSVLNDVKSVFGWMSAAQIADARARTRTLDLSAVIQTCFTDCAAGGFTPYFPDGDFLLVAAGLRVQWDNFFIWLSYGATIYWNTQLPLQNDCSSWNGAGGGAAITVAKLNSIQPNTGVLPDPGIPAAAASNLITLNFKLLGGGRLLSDGNFATNPGVVVTQKQGLNLINCDYPEIADITLEGQHTEPIGGGLVRYGRFSRLRFKNCQHGGFGLVAQMYCKYTDTRMFDVWQPMETTGIGCDFGDWEIVNSAVGNNGIWMDTSSLGHGVFDNTFGKITINGSFSGSHFLSTYTAGGANVIKRNTIDGLTIIDPDQASSAKSFMTLQCKGAGLAWDVKNWNFTGRWATVSSAVKPVTVNCDADMNEVRFRNGALNMDHAPVYFAIFAGNFSPYVLMENNDAYFLDGNPFAVSTEDINIQNKWARFNHDFFGAGMTHLQFRNNRVNGISYVQLDYAGVSTANIDIPVSSERIFITGANGGASYSIGRAFGETAFCIENGSGVNATLKHHAGTFILLSGADTTLAAAASAYFVPLGGGNKYKQIA